jgi:hypothetical protein
MSRTGSLLAGLALLVGLSGSVLAVQEGNPLSPTANKILEEAVTLEFFSLDPTPPKEKPREEFHGWKVLGKTVVKNRATRTQLLEALRQGIADNTGIAAACFNPRHGIRAKADGKTLDLVISFECLSMQLYLDDKRTSVLTADTPQGTFDKILKAAGVPLPPKPKGGK